MEKYTGFHDPACTGCPKCSELAAALLANPTNPVLGEAMGRPHLRAVAERALRTTASRQTQSQNVQATDAAWRSHFARALGVGSIVTEPPDPYERGRLRSCEPTDDPHYQPFGTPPNGYDLALGREKRR